MILGKGEPKYIYNGTTIVLLDHSILDPKFSDPDIIDKKSVVNGKRKFKIKGDYAEFNVIVHLFKYDPNRIAKFNTIYSHRFQDVVFYPFRDGSVLGDGLGKPIKDINNNNVLFTMTRCELFFKNDNDDLDCLLLEFKATDYIDLSKSVQ